MKLYNLVKNRKVQLGILAIVVGSLSSRLSTTIIGKFFEERYVNVDLVFKLVPQMHILEVVPDLTIVVMLLLFCWYVLRPEIARFPYILTVVGSAYTARAVLNTLTPLGKPSGDNEASLGLFKHLYIQYGMLPSGHTALALLLLMMTDQKRYPLLKQLMFLLFVLEASTLIVSRAHYSIDVAAGAMLAYILYRLFAPYRNALTLSKDECIDCGLKSSYI